MAIRSATRDDVDAITRLIGTCELANDGLVEVDRTDVEQSFDLTGDDGIVLVEEVDAAGVRELVAWATCADGRAEVDVRPDRLGRGIGSALLEWTEARARQLGDTRVRQTVTDGNARAHALFPSRGYERAHTSWILQMPLGDDPPAVVVPAGIAIRAFTEADAHDVYRIVEDAFQEWRDPSSFERWETHVHRHPAFSAELSRLAFDEDELVGVAIATDYPDSPEGWVQQLATKASHRHRGIARAVLHASAAAFHARGRRTIGLSTDSRTGALSLYEHLGMRVRRSYTSWTKDLR